MPIDRNRYHRRSIRLPGFDYAGAGSYFVTICAHQRALLFGNIRNDDVVLNECGRIVLEEWHRSADLRREVELDAVVVMPNHVHGIVSLVCTDDEGYRGRGPRVSGGDGKPENPEMGAHRAPLQRRPRSLGSFVAGFKAASTSRIRQHFSSPDLPVWQRNYYEHVIRNDDAYARIYNYLMTNPIRWVIDRENPDRWGDDEFDAWLPLVPADTQR
jgi:REP element-mobilizing transposase RayT